MKITDKLKKIRSLMKNLSIDCYLIPHSDEFSNEFLPPYSRRLEWISDFTGSAGDIIITDKKATTPIATNTPVNIFPAFILICRFLF